MSQENDNPKFTSSVTSGGMLNIPQRFQEMNDIEENDLIEVEMTRHKKVNNE